MKTILIKYCFGLLLFIYAGSQAQQNHPVRSVPDSVSEALKKQEAFRYANDPSFWAVEKQEDNSAVLNLLNTLGTSPLIRWAVYIFLALIIIFIIYQVAVVNNFFIFSRSGKKKTAAAASDEELMADDLDGRINKAIADKEYRLAIRFLYLKTLSTLKDKNRIKVHARATNQDYMQQMQHFPAAKEFNMLTRVYEYVWYGEFQPDIKQFETIRNNFDQFISHD